MAKKIRSKAALHTAANIRRMKEDKFVHFLNPGAIRYTRSLGDAAGLQTLGVHLVRLKPGDASTEYHFHHQDEEWVYILSGRGTAEIGGRKYKIGAGDFMGFTAVSKPHAMTNPHKGDLVYLVGGNRSSLDVCDYPRIGKRRYRMNGENIYLDLAALHPVKRNLK
ncbi:MAG TPA: cupin domain-containing protein [Burkholderiales bacterium]|nr:cupin domain-containing protein [Burkholderiales bacterium]